MKQIIKHLDCTLRDGGYYNNWDFSESFLNRYLEVASLVGVDFVELGFRFYENIGFKGPYAFMKDTFINEINIPQNLKVSIMINGKDLIHNGKLDFCRIEKLVPNHKNKSKVDLIRIAVNFDDFFIVSPVFSYLQDKGYLLGINIMQISDENLNWKKLAMSSESEKINILYIADSFGSFSPDGIKEIFENIQTYWKGELGIHAHDNRNLALHNTINAVKTGVTWVDSTIRGMGRGAGNAKTEELILELDEINEKSTNIVPLLRMIDEIFEPMRQIYGWGTNIFYQLAAKYSIHPSYVQKMMEEKYCLDDILAVLEFLNKSGGAKFSIDQLSLAKSFFHGEPKGNWSPSTLLEGKDILLIGSGEKFKDHKIAIEKFIKEKKPIVIALNTKEYINNKLIDLRIACHPVRMMADIDIHMQLPQPLITPLSMLPKKLSTKLSEKEIYDFGLGISNNSFQFKKTYCFIPKPLVFAYAIALAVSGNAKQIYLAGFDGFESDEKRNIELEGIIQLFLKANTCLKITAITPTTYKGIESKSVYGI